MSPDDLAEGILGKVLPLLRLAGGWTNRHGEQVPVCLEDVDGNYVDLTPAEADYLRRRWSL